jgi:hypothetical protein
LDYLHLSKYGGIFPRCVCVNVYMYVYMYVYMCVYVYVYVGGCVRVYVCGVATGAATASLYCLFTYSIAHVMLWTSELINLYLLCLLICVLLIGFIYLSHISP